MSRFFRGGNSDSDSETTSDDSSSVYSDADETALKSAVASAAASAGPAPTGYAAKASGAARSAFSRFLRNEDESDSDSDDGKRVVRSAKDKLFDELRITIRAVENGKKINDWLTVQGGMFVGARGTRVLFALNGRIYAFIPIRCT